LSQRVLLRRVASRVPENPLEHWLNRLDPDSRKVCRSHFNRFMRWLHKQKGWESITSRELIIHQLEAEDAYEIVDHFTCIEMEEQETVSGKRYHHYAHPEGSPDDALHAFIYALIAESVEGMTYPLVIQDLF
jgi:hypothetical protein